MWQMFLQKKQKQKSRLKFKQKKSDLRGIRLDTSCFCSGGMLLC